nr:immunoglobulin heavy chain junction region [Mus musculus]
CAREGELGRGWFAYW